MSDRKSHRRWGLMALAVGTGLVTWVELGEDRDGDALIRWTIRCALVAYAVYGFAAISLPSDSEPLDNSGPPWLLAVWTWGASMYLVHVLAAFHFFHGWSHRHVWEHTQARSGFGAGVYVSYLFSVVWLGSALGGWLAPAARRYRIGGDGLLLHTFMAFIVFNGAIIFAPTPTREISAATVLAWLLFWFFKRTDKSRNRTTPRESSSVEHH